MRYSTAPASRARDGMLKPRGVVKKSGKIVTTLIRRGRASAVRSASGVLFSVIEQAGRRVDPNDPRVSIDRCHEAVVGYEDRSLVAPDVERESLR